MADVRRIEHGGREPADRDGATAARHVGEERERRIDLAARRAAVRAGGSRMRRHDVPQEHGLLEPELVEHAVHDRRRRLGGAAAGQLPLRGERETADTCAAISGRLADEHDRRIGSGSEVRTEPVAPALRAAVLVERPADADGGEPVYQVFQCTCSSMARRRCVARLVVLLHPGSGAPRPMVTPATIRRSSGMSSSARHAGSCSTGTP
jgi:hypothetical protein